MTLPIQALIDTHEALSDWRLSIEETNQIVASVWEGVLVGIVFTAVLGLCNRVLDQEFSRR